MLFPTAEYALFFAVAFAAAWGLSRHVRLHKVALLSLSYVFYAWWDWRFVPLLAGLSMVATGIARLLQVVTSARLRWWAAALGVAVQLTTLVAYKYLTFAVSALADVLERAGVQAELRGPEWVLPVGLSFITFHGISLTVDAYRRQVPVQVTLLDGLLYVAFFPQLVAGPILRSSDFLLQLHRGPRRDVDVAAAAVVFASGLAKKVLLANFLATQVVDPFYAAPETASAVDAALAFYGYAAQIYCDFSGYTDMAIASAALLGYSFPQNFDAPYSATSLRDFWRRWHMSLSSWLRDYVYVSLGGSRGGAWHTARNLFITMVLGGLWHGAGATFALWGAFHGAGLVLERFAPWSVRSRWVARLLTFHFVALGWVLFRSPSLEVVGKVVAAFARLSWSTRGLGLAAGIFVALALLIQATPLAWSEKVRALAGRLPAWAVGAAFGVSVMAIAAMGPHGVWPFIYFQF